MRVAASRPEHAVMGGRGKEVGRNHPPPPDRPRFGLASLRIGSSTSRRASGRTVSLTHRKCCIGNVSWGIASWAIRHTTRIVPNTGPYTPSFKLQVMPRSRGRPSSVDGTAARKRGQTGRWPFLRRSLIHPPPLPSLSFQLFTDTYSKTFSPRSERCLAARRP